VALHQLAEKRGARRLVDAGRGDAGAHALENRRNRAGELAPLLDGRLGLDAPEQLIHGLERALPRGAFRAFARVHDQQVLDPLLREEFHDRARRRRRLQPVGDRLLGRGLGDGEALDLLELLLRGLHLVGHVRIVLGDDFLEAFAHGVEDLHLFLEAVDQLLDEGLELVEKRAFGVEIRGQAQPDLPERVEQLARRMRPSW
jgi:hypothetical protein